MIKDQNEHKQDAGGKHAEANNQPTNPTLNPPPVVYPATAPLYIVGPTAVVADSEPAPKNFAFDDVSIRRSFIRKVYSILLAQIGITFAIVTLFTFHEGTKQFAAENRWIGGAAILVMLPAMICMACCDNLRRQTPTNYIFLTIITIAVALMTGFSTLRFHQNEIMLAVGITFVICVALTLFAFQTKYDFTMIGGLLMVAVVVLLVFGIVAIFVKTKLVVLIYATVGAVLFSAFLIYDTQLMVGGKHKYSISPEEYIFAALNLYMDIINIFLQVLAIIGASRN